MQQHDLDSTSFDKTFHTALDFSFSNNRNSTSHQDILDLFKDSPVRSKFEDQATLELAVPAVATTSTTTITTEEIVGFVRTSGESERGFVQSIHQLDLEQQKSTVKDVIELDLGENFTAHRKSRAVILPEDFNDDDSSTATNNNHIHTAHDQHHHLSPHLNMPHLHFNNANFQKFGKRFLSFFPPIKPFNLNNNNNHQNARPPPTVVIM